MQLIKLRIVRQRREVQAKKRCIQLCSNEIQTIEPIFESKIGKGGDSMSPAPSGRGRKKVRGVWMKKDRRIQSCSNEIQTLEPIFKSKIRKGGIACPPPPRRGRKVRGEQTKKDKGWNPLPFLLKYCNALEWESRFTLALNAVKNIDYIEKCCKQKLFIIKVPTKSSVSAYLYLPWKWS